MFPLLHEQPVLGAVGRGFVTIGPPYPEQIFFDPLMEPSLQTKFPPAQWDMPPFRPEHGVLASAPPLKNRKASVQSTFFRMMSPQMPAATKQRRPV